MRQLLDFWRAELARNPAAYAPLACLIAGCAMNAHAGYVLGGGSFLVVVLFVAIAVMAAYAGTTGLELPTWGLRKIGLVFLVLPVGIAVDQLSAWQTLGLTFADGQAARDTKATGLSTANETLQAKREERKALGRFRPVETIQAEADFECKIVGPRCTGLRSELGRAKRALQLDGEIAAAVKALEGREQVASGRVQFTVPIKIAQTVRDWWWKPAPAPVVEGDDISYVVMLVLAFTVCLYANIGFWLVGVGHAPVPAAHRGDDHDPDAAASWPRDPRPVGPDFGARALLPAPPRALAALPAPQVVGTPGPGSNVNITFGGLLPAQAAPAPGVAVAPDGAAPAADEDKPEPQRGPRRDLEALPGAVPPIDRSRVRRELSAGEREAADVLLAFQAACLVDTPAGMVTGEHVYRRYQAWAGERAIEPSAFLALFPDVTGIEMVEIGGVWHAKHVALRAGAALQSVGATRAA